MKSLKKSVIKRTAIIIFVAVLAFSSAACSSGSKNTSQTGGEKYSGVTIRIAEQFGMHYAAAYVMEKLNLLDKYLPGAKLEVSQLSGGSTLNEALVAGQLDVGFMGIPPMLIAWSKGADFRIAEGISVLPLDLMVKDKNINSLKDIKPSDKIAVPGIGSIQQIIISMAAKQQLGDAKALDKNIVAMAHPDAYSALISGSDVTGHFCSIPYNDMEMKAGCHSILTDTDVYGPSSIVCVTTKKFHDGNKEVYDGLMAALSDAIDLINAHDANALQVIADTEKISTDDALRYVTWPNVKYDTKVYGSMGLAQFMYDQGLIDKCPASTSDIMWDNAQPVDNNN